MKISNGWILAWVLCILFGMDAIAQERFTLSGIIKDQKNGELLTGASIRIIGTNGSGAVANEYGYYSLTVPKGEYQIVVSFIGYKADTIAMRLDKNQKIDFALADNSVIMKEFTVSSKRKDENIKAIESGISKISPKEINKIPVLLGERDLVKAIQLMPGVKSAGEGNSGFFVRGGAADQNLILLDEAPVYNASHLLGFFSTFNSDAIRDATLYKGTQPAQYGGRLSSVLDLKMNEGNNQDFSVGGGIGLISSRLNIEGPIVKDKGSFLVTGRRTYADAFLKLSNDPVTNSSSLYFYDLNMKANYKISDKDRIFVSGYLGRDKLGFGETMGIDWGNYTTTIRWNHLINNRIFSNTSFIVSNYDYNVAINSTSDEFSIKSRIKDYNLKQEFQYYLNPSYSMKFGFNSIYHDLVPGKVESAETSTINASSSSLQNRYSWDNSLFLSNDVKVNERFSFKAGLRLTSFSIVGEGDYYVLDDSKNIIDTLNYSKGELVKNYLNLEPRLSVNYGLSPSSSIKAGYFRNVQNLHLISNSTSSNPTDKLIASTKFLKP